PVTSCPVVLLVRAAAFSIAASGLVRTWTIIQLFLVQTHVRRGTLSSLNRRKWMRRPGHISRARRAQIRDEAHQLYILGRTRSRNADQIQQDLLRAFPGELTRGEARLYAMGWTVRVVREGLRGLAANDGLDASGVGDGEVWRWLRGEVRPTVWMEPLCRLFGCHQAQIGWPPQGNEPPIDSTRAGGVVDA